MPLNLGCVGHALEAVQEKIPALTSRLTKSLEVSLLGKGPSNIPFFWVISLKTLSQFKVFISLEVFFLFLLRK